MNSQVDIFLKSVFLGSSKVSFPERVYFLCGGPLSKSNSKITSLRDYMFKSRDKIFSDGRIMLAERAAEKFDTKLFDNLLVLERHIASICTGTVLVSESVGSIAELGAFSQIDEINKRMLVLIQSGHYSQTSFVKDGPIRYLENLNEECVQEFEWETNRAGNITKVSAALLDQPLIGAISEFYSKQPKTQKFDKNAIGHKILLVAGIIEMLSCCKLREIKRCIDALDIEMTETSLRQILFCLNLFGWVKKIKRDTQYYMYVNNVPAFIFRGKGFIDPIRTRFLIAQEYKDSVRLQLMESR